MNYTPHTEADVNHMLQTIGVNTTADLFQSIPEPLRVKDLRLPPGISEMEVLAAVDAIASDVAAHAPSLSFLGGGAYDHFSPSVVDAMISRGEFFTAYTPYQPEVSQGTLRAIFEFQTMMCELTGMEVANASMYDGSSALAEAVLMSVRLTGGSRVLLPRSLHPFYKQVIETYVKGIALELVEIPWDETGGIDRAVLKRELNSDTAAVVIQNPNFFGVLEALDEIGDMVGSSPAAFVACVNPMSLSLIRPPGDFGADIVVGDGQPLGLPLAFGGPYVGFFASREAHLRKMPGRICGQTTDVDGKRGFVLTLQTREQHIRRDKATSNICTKQTLCA
ncbi:MAG: aminomethyl-transferring glycine dehydrogenase subunit GcvPA, partial [bacterium]|nr:aminomethyl-transferring glycine dehydrogenase subunit GcvPA [bacterium]